MKQRKAKQRQRQWVSKKSARRRYVLTANSRNFSDVEDNPNGFQVIKALVVKAGLDAATEARVAGIQRAYVRNGIELVKIAPNGAISSLPSKVIAGHATVHPKEGFYVKHKPGTILHVSKK